MQKWKLIVAAMKPPRIIVAHLSFWLACLYFGWQNQSLSWLQVGEIVLFLYFYGNMYLINDFADRKRDSGDVVNKGRNIASGKLNTADIVTAITVNLVIALASAALLSHYLLMLFVAALMLNAAYSFFLKSIPYIDLVWISLTQCVKFLTGMVIMLGFSYATIFSYLPVMLLLYLVGLEFHVDKQRGKLAYGLKRDFFVGKMTDKGLLTIQRISLALDIAVMVVFFSYPVVPFVAIPNILTDMLRMLFPAFGAQYFFKIQGLAKGLRSK